MKAQVTEKGIYTYYKAVLGSYKDFVPNHYALGYYMVGNSRVHYGPDIWQDALSRVGKVLTESRLLPAASNSR